MEGTPPPPQEKEKVRQCWFPWRPQWQNLVLWSQHRIFLFSNLSSGRLSLKRSAAEAEQSRFNEDFFFFVEAHKVELTHAQPPKIESFVCLSDFAPRLRCDGISAAATCQLQPERSLLPFCPGVASRKPRNLEFDAKLRWECWWRPIWRDREQMALKRRSKNHFKRFPIVFLAKIFKKLSFSRI